MANERERIESLLSAAELLLADVQAERGALDRRERELLRAVTDYRARLQDFPPLTRAEVGAENGEANKGPDLFGESEDTDSDADKYGAISAAVLEIMADYGKKVNTPFLTAQLQIRRVPIRAKSYNSAVRTALRRLHDTGKIKRQGTGWYRLVKPVEHVHAA
jgi:hypothetical protein